MGFRVNASPEIVRVYGLCLDAWGRWHTELCRLKALDRPEPLIDIYGGVVDKFADYARRLRDAPEHVTTRERIIMEEEAHHLTPMERYAQVTGELCADVCG